MRAILLRAFAALLLVAGVYEFWSERALLRLQFRGGWTLYPPGIYERFRFDILLGVGLLIAAAVLAFLSFARLPSKPQD